MYQYSDYNDYSVKNISGKTENQKQINKKAKSQRSRISKYFE